MAHPSAAVPLSLSVGDDVVAIALDSQAAPRTAERLLASLPARIDLHCAKIAGNHILWHAPFVEPLEGGEDVMAMAPGAFLYWPERQFLELVFGELQAETAKVTVLGRVWGDIEPLRRIGARVAAEHGHRVVWGELAGPPGAGEKAQAAEEDAAASPALQALRAERRALWDGPPAEIAAMMHRRGLMLPAGPLLMAESEARKLHEGLWLALLALKEGSTGPAAVFMLRSAASRLAGFCGLAHAGDVLSGAAATLEAGPDDAQTTVEELILYAGRLAAWLDLRIPWGAVNAEVVKAADGWPGDEE